MEHLPKFEPVSKRLESRKTKRSSLPAFEKKSRNSSKRSCAGATKQRSPALLHVKPERL